MIENELSMEELEGVSGGFSFGDAVAAWELAKGAYKLGKEQWGKYRHMAGDTFEHWG